MSCKFKAAQPFPSFFPLLCLCVFINSPVPAGAGPRNLRARRGGSSSSSRGGATGRQVSRATGSTQTMMRLYSDDAPGLKVDPVVVLVLSLVFIASVFLLHIYGKLTGTKN
ncbi:hypothetical protein GQ54DRAFT_301477 [Martensiomyces pterosporus]|nr:hypothetical protein GQ54DRAFT_301477 [Martensiomyces pterosporus]